MYKYIAVFHLVRVSRFKLQLRKKRVKEKESRGNEGIFTNKACIFAEENILYSRGRDAICHCWIIDMYNNNKSDRRMLNYWFALCVCISHFSAAAACICPKISSKFFLLLDSRSDAPKNSVHTHVVSTRMWRTFKSINNIVKSKRGIRRRKKKTRNQHLHSTFSNQRKILVIVIFNV